MTGPTPFGAPPTRAILADGRRRHFQHGPIDLVIEAFGPDDELARAHDHAWARFATILGELVGELASLRAPAGAGAPPLKGLTARRMAAACAPHAEVFVTPMAAVAGAVADEVLAALVDGRSLEKAYVNNGGDIALHVSPGASFGAGIVSLAQTPEAAGAIAIGHDSPVRGIATSGWRGRSLSLGIADSVTVLARSAAAADVAATLIANAVDVDDPAIERAPARSLDPDSDLGDRLVTVAVGPMVHAAVARALDRGADAARSMVEGGRIVAAHLILNGASRSVGEGPSKLVVTVTEEGLHGGAVAVLAKDKDVRAAYLAV